MGKIQTPKPEKVTFMILISFWENDVEGRMMGLILDLFKVLLSQGLLTCRAVHSYLT